MKKILLIIIVFIMFPVIPSAINLSEDISEVKYYKTTTIYNDVSVLSITDNVITSTEVITKEEYDKANIKSNLVINSSTTVETTYKKMTTTISANGSYYRYKVVLEWKNMPSVRSYDVIAIGYYASVEPVSSIYFSQKYCLSTSNCKTSTSSTIISKSNGTGAVFKLPSDTIVSLTQTLYFDVTKSADATVISQKVVGDYAHATKTVSEETSKTFDINTGGISFSSSTSNSYDTISEAIVNWSGSW